MGIAIIAAIVIVLIIAIAGYLKFGPSAGATSGTTATEPKIPTGPIVKIIPPANKLSSISPKYCHKCDINCTPGNCLYGCSKGLEFEVAGRLPGTPMIISDYRIEGVDAEIPDIGKNNGNHYWYRQKYDQAACPAKYTGKYEALLVNTAASSVPISTEVCTPGCWPGECMYKPTTKWLYGDNDQTYKDAIIKAQQLCKATNDAEACRATRLNAWYMPGNNIEPMVTLDEKTVIDRATYNKGPIYFADYPYESPGSKMKYTYGRYFTNGDVVCNE